MNGLNSSMDTISQFQQTSNGQYARFQNSINVVQIQPTTDFSIGNNNNSNIMNMPQNNRANSSNYNNNKPSKRKAETYSCTVCAIEVTSQDVLQSHMNGQKHAKKLRQIADSNQAKTSSMMEVTTKQQEAMTLEEIKQEHGTSGTASTNTNLQAKQAVDSKSALQKLNELASFNKLKCVYEILSDVGPQHAKVFEIKCSLIDLKTNECIESVTSSGTSHIKAKQTAAEIVLKNTKFGFPSKEHIAKKKNAKNELMKQFVENKKNKRDTRITNPTTPEAESISSTENKAKSSYREKTFKSPAELAFDDYEHTNKYFIKSHLLAKHKQIQPSREQLDLISYLVTSIEKSLKKISDKLVDEEIASLPAPMEAASPSGEQPKPDESKETHRHLKGVVRVGTIVKTLFLKTDRDLHLVVLTSKVPTHAFIKRISDELATELENISEEQAIVVNEVEIKDEVVEVAADGSEETRASEYKPPKIIYHMDKSEELIKSEACVNIRCELPECEFLAEANDQYNVKVSFTSMSLLATAEAASAHVSDVSLDKCKSALTEIRRVKWFNARLKQITNAILVLRIMRDLCQRNPTWSCLNDWLLELIIEKCFIRNRYEDVSMKLRAVFECVSSGLLFLPQMSVQCRPKFAVATAEPASAAAATAENPDITTIGFVDPCAEVKSEADVFEKNLTIQQREELTASAQNFLRMISLRKVHEVLAIDLIKISLSHQRYRQNNSNGFRDYDNKFRRVSNNGRNGKGKSAAGSIGGVDEAVKSNIECDEPIVTEVAPKVETLEKPQEITSTFID